MTALIVIQVVFVLAAFPCFIFGPISDYTHEKLGIWNLIPMLLIFALCGNPLLHLFFVTVCGLQAIK